VTLVKGKLALSVSVAGLVGLGTVQLTSAAPSLNPQKPDNGSISMRGSLLPPDPAAGQPTVGFSGKLNAPDNDCVNGRRVRVIDADVKSVVALGRARGKKGKGKWSARGVGLIGTTYTGDAYAEAPRGDGCSYLRSKTVNFPAPPSTTAPISTADLFITKVSALNDGNDRAQYTITVGNNGPGQADGVVVTDDPEVNFYAMGSDPRCGPDDVSLFTCNIGSISPGTQVQLFVKVTCPGNDTNNSASVASSTPDPNLGNNATGLVVNNPC